MISDKQTVLSKKFFSPLSIATAMIGFLILSLVISVLMSAITVGTTPQTTSENSIQEKELSEYDALLERQRQALYGRRSNHSPGVTEVKSGTEARGRHTLTIVFVKSDSVNEDQIQPLIDALTQKQHTIFNDCVYNYCEQSVSLGYIPAYYTEQARRYGVTDFNLDIKYSDIKNLSRLEAIGDFSYAWGKNPFGAANLQDAFEATIAKDASIKADSPVVFLFFDDSFLPPMENIESFYEYKKFRSFADERKGRAYVNVFGFYPELASEITTIVAHEALHLFGANDKYVELPKSQNEVCKKEGYGQPDKMPLFPQKTGDIMCLVVQVDNSNYKDGNLKDGSLVINRYTAKEIGWTAD
jgi:hypothetical protein